MRRDVALRIGLGLLELASGVSTGIMLAHGSWAFAALFAADGAAVCYLLLRRPWESSESAPRSRGLRSRAMPARLSRLDE